MYKHLFLFVFSLAISFAKAQKINPHNFIPSTQTNDFNLKGNVKEVISTVKNSNGKTATFALDEHEFYDQIKYEFDAKNFLVKKTFFLDYRGKLGIYSFTDYKYIDSKLVQQTTTILNNGEDPKRIAVDKKYTYNNKNKLVSLVEIIRSKTNETNYETQFIYDQVLKEILTKTDGINSSKNLLTYNKKGLLIKDELISFDGKKGMVKTFIYDYNELIYQEEMINNTSSITFLDHSKNSVKWQQFDAKQKLISEIIRNQNQEVITLKNTTFVDGKSQLNTYSISYTYDSKENWIKADISKGNKIIYTITREIKYN